MTLFVLIAAYIAAGVLALALVLTLLPRLGRAGRAVSDAFTRPPLLDLALGALTTGPWIGRLPQGLAGRPMFLS